MKSVGESVEKPVIYYRNNLGSLLNLLTVRPFRQVARHLFLSSDPVHGRIPRKKLRLLVVIDCLRRPSILTARRAAPVHWRRNCQSLRSKQVHV